MFKLLFKTYYTFNKHFFDNIKHFSISAEKVAGNGQSRYHVFNPICIDSTYIDSALDVLVYYFAFATFATSRAEKKHRTGKLVVRMYKEAKTGAHQYIFIKLNHRN